ncbi:MAG: pyridoxal phosphate-dependent aminotransferase, partial [Lachnospiraceae bacterium]
YKENGGVIFPNPNAPTGISESKLLIEDIVKHNEDVIIIVDEAYVDFDDSGSAIDLIDKYENLLVVQTFSKSRSMAGMRIGFAIGSKEVIAALNNVKYSFNSYTMDALSLHMGVEAVRDVSYFNSRVEQIVSTREWVKEELKHLSFTFPDSKANFIFAKHTTIEAKHIFQELKSKNIYVRYFDKPRIDNYLRISIGTREEMEVFIEALKDIIKN